MVEPEPAELVRLAQGGDIGAFEGLYRAHVGRVYAICLRMCGSAARAKELTQDVFVRAWERMGSFRGNSAFASWLHRVAVNVVLADARSARRREARLELVEDPAALKLPASSTPDGLLDLETAIAGLPQRARMVFVLHEIEGYKHHEIAEQLGVAEGTVRAQLHRARRLLMEALER